MSAPPRRLIAPQVNAARSKRLTLLSIDERPASVDPILANIFKTMRASTGMTIERLAQSLATTPATIHGLEAGHIRLFSSPEDATRLIETYGSLLRMDVRPILDRLVPQIDDRQAPLQRAAPPARLDGNPGQRLMTHAAPKDDQGNPPLRRKPNGSAVARDQRVPVRRRKRSRPVRWLKRFAYISMAAVALAAGTVMVAESHPRAARAAVGQLPASLAHGVRGFVDRVNGLLGGRNDGLRWIEVSDPRTRKADRISVSR